MFLLHSCSLRYPMFSCEFRTVSRRYPMFCWMFLPHGLGTALRLVQGDRWSQRMALAESSLAAIAQAAALRQSGWLTDAEFEAVKARVLAPVLAEL